MSHYIIGSGLEGECPICDLSPIAVRTTATKGFGECPRCGLPYVTAGPHGEPIEKPICAARGGFVGLLRKYWEVTARKITLSDTGGATPLDPIRQERLDALKSWINDHPHLYSLASAAETWPFATLVGVVAELDDGRTVWRILSPPSGLSPQMPQTFPIPVDNLPAGTVCTLSIPAISAPAEPPAQPESPEEETS